MDRRQTHWHIIRNLLICSALLAVLFIGWGGAFTNVFIVQLRAKKLAIFALVSICSAFSTITFQAIVNSRFLSPGILGIESYYRLLQTLWIFFGFRILTVPIGAAGQFLVVTSLMVLSFLLLGKFSFQNVRFDLHTVLLIGLVISMLFNSLSTFFQVLMDPNEYDQLQMRLFPTFQNVSNSVFYLAALLALLVLLSLWRKRKTIEVLAMGTEQAINLGINANREIRMIFLHIIILATIPAVLVGPMIFLGFTTANVAYLLLKTYRMALLLIGGSVIGFLALLISQFLVEQVFELQTNASIMIEWLGGILFFVLLWKERDQL